MIIPYPYIPKREVPGRWGESFLILRLFDFTGEFKAIKETDRINWKLHLFQQSKNHADKGGSQPRREEGAHTLRGAAGTRGVPAFFT